MLEIKQKLTLEMIQSLLQGHKLCFRNDNDYEVELFPPHYGYFLKPEQYAELKIMAHHSNYPLHETNKIFEKIENNNANLFKKDHV